MLAIGPAIDTGFYYDFDLERTFSPEDLTAIEAEMKKIIKEDLPIERFELAPDAAKALMEEQGQKYKVELVEEHASEGEPISFYRQGEFTDLCAGPHLMSTGSVKAVRLTSCTGAYWRGDSRARCSSAYTASPSQGERGWRPASPSARRPKSATITFWDASSAILPPASSSARGLPILLPNGARHSAAPALCGG